MQSKWRCRKVLRCFFIRSFFIKSFAPKTTLLDICPIPIFQMFSPVCFFSGGLVLFSSDLFYCQFAWVDFLLSFWGFFSRHAWRTAWICLPYYFPNALFSKYGGTKIFRHLCDFLSVFRIYFLFAEQFFGLFSPNFFRRFVPESKNTMSSANRSEISRVFESAPKISLCLFPPPQLWWKSCSDLFPSSTINLFRQILIPIFLPSGVAPIISFLKPFVPQKKIATNNIR